MNFEYNSFFSNNSLSFFEELTFWKNVWYSGIAITDMENIVLCLLFVRFIVLTFKYNLKTAFYIVSISILAGYLWYKHLVDTIFIYSQILVNVPFLYRLADEALELNTFTEAKLELDLDGGANVSWREPTQILYYAFYQAIVKINPTNGLYYNIDPFSLMIANFEKISYIPEFIKSKVLYGYYKIYLIYFPEFVTIVLDFLRDYGSTSAYMIIVRIGKRYCPYLIRWHWTFLVTLNFVEPIIASFINRLCLFQTNILAPQAAALSAYSSSSTFAQTALMQLEFSNLLIVGITVLHITFLFFGLLHAICGQYFYLPLFVDVTELHIGPRPKESIYSGGLTAWQDKKDKDIKQVFPKLWYGWFGRGTETNVLFNKKLKKFVKKIIKKLKQFINRQ